MRTLSSLSPVCMGLRPRDYHSNVSESRVDPKDAQRFSSQSPTPEKSYLGQVHTISTTTRNAVQIGRR